jgi:hypothetical protein
MMTVNNIFGRVQTEVVVVYFNPWYAFTTARYSTVRVAPTTFMTKSHEIESNNY